MRVFILIVHYVLLQQVTSKLDSTPDLPKRIENLKKKIFEDRKNKLRSKGLVVPIGAFDYSSSESIEYVDKNRPITPIMDNYERKADDMYFRQLRTTPPLETLSKPISKQNVNLKKRIVKQKSKTTKYQEIFYRRWFLDELRHESFDRIHCRDLVTPFLTNILNKNTDMSVKLLKPNDKIVIRLLQLLKVDTNSYNADEIYALLYQIKNLNLRFFQWDETAMDALLDTIIGKGALQSFITLKMGIKKLFNRWKLDITNTTNLLKEARVFRPPCFGPPYEGSTKFPQDHEYHKHGRGGKKVKCENKEVLDSAECEQTLAHSTVDNQEE